MKYIKNILALIGLVAVVSTLIFAVQSSEVEEAPVVKEVVAKDKNCLLYTSDAADE